MDLTLIRFGDIPGIAMLQSFGEKILGLAFLALFIREAFKLLRGEQPDWVGPIARVGAAFLILANVQNIGDWVSGTVLNLSGTMGDESKLALFGRAVGTALDATTCDQSLVSATIGVLFSIRGLIALLSGVLYIAMYVVKFVVIDVLYPVCFGLVLFLGVLTVPISVFPGMGGLSGWLKNVVEVSLWPVVFQFLVAMMAASFPQVIGAMADGRIILECGGVAESAIVSVGYDHGIIAVLKFMAICASYIALLLFTPLLSALVVRSAPVSVMGGVLAAKAGGLLQDAAKMVAARLPAFSSGSGSSAGAGSSTSAGATAAALDQRSTGTTDGKPQPTPPANNGPKNQAPNSVRASSPNIDTNNIDNSSGTARGRNAKQNNANNERGQADRPTGQKTKTADPIGYDDTPDELWEAQFRQDECGEFDAGDEQ